LISVGLDVGSRTIKLVVLNNGNQESTVIDTGVNPLRRSQEILAGRDYRRLMVTGYGRHLAAPVLKGETVSEIKAFAAGARHVVSGCHTVIDIGGQDSKVILLSEQGAVQKFEMNDRCAAGTGKFLEIMAGALEVKIDEIGGLALSAIRHIQINSLCTVFAESEVVSLIARGEEAGAIALALHEAVVTRIATMIGRIGLKEKVVFAGGGSLNRCLRSLLEKKLGLEIVVPENPQIIGALGAALLAGEQPE
jgi:predicted CoA-substrate-specific enzyme activase